MGLAEPELLMFSKTVLRKNKNGKLFPVVSRMPLHYLTRSLHILMCVAGLQSKLTSRHVSANFGKYAAILMSFKPLGSDEYLAGDIYDKLDMWTDFDEY